MRSFLPLKLTMSLSLSDTIEHGLVLQPQSLASQLQVETRGRSVFRLSMLELPVTKAFGRTRGELTAPP